MGNTYRNPIVKQTEENMVGLNSAYSTFNQSEYRQPTIVYIVLTETPSF